MKTKNALIPWTDEQKATFEDIYKEFGSPIPWKQIKEEMPDIWNVLTDNGRRKENQLWQYAYHYKKTKNFQVKKKSKVARAATAEMVKETEAPSSVSYCPCCGVYLEPYNVALKISQENK